MPSRSEPPARPTLRFSKSGDATIERLCRTHLASPNLSEEATAHQPEREISETPLLRVLTATGISRGSLTMNVVPAPTWV